MEISHQMAGINEPIITRMNQAERDVLAYHPNLVNQTAASPESIHR